jgi:hypothetical protein
MRKHSFASSPVALCVATGLLGALGCTATQRPTELAPSPAIISAGNETAPGRTGASSASPLDAGRAEFEYRRLHSAGGQFITRDELARVANFPLLDILQTHIRGFASRRNAQPSIAGDVTATIEVYLNGLRTTTIDGLRPADLMGVEYYQANAAPVKYQRTFSSAPVLLLWLKP